jgi:diacylglycerol kinase (ATP)
VEELDHHVSTTASGTEQQERPLRVAFVVNPRSGSDVSADELERVLRGAGAEVQRLAVEEVERAGDTRPDRVVVAGGDGTIAPAAAAAASSGAELAVVPTGTANDFARAFELPDDPREACRLAVTGSSVRAFDLARIENRPFVNAANAGLAVVAARRAEAKKGVLGSLAYVVGAFSAALRSGPVRCRISCDGRETFAGKAWQVVVANSGAFGAGSEVEADPADGRLDVIVVEAGSRLRLAVHGLSLRFGRLESQRGVRHERAERVRVELEGRGFNVDGEIVETSGGDFTVEPAAVRLVVG